MGIPFYFYQLCKKYSSKNIVGSTWPYATPPTHLHFDYNSLIHPCVHEVLGDPVSEGVEGIALEDMFIEALLKYTSKIVGEVRPTNTVHIAVDGVAPRAKMNQQRERRYKSAFCSEKRWDTNQITPGTPFMQRLAAALHAYRLPGVHVVVSDASEPGEGEHKIMQYIRERHIASPNAFKHTVYGLDADLIMLSLFSPEADNIVLFRDNANKYDLHHVKRFEYLFISALKQYIVADLLGNGEESPDHSARVVQDYVFVCCMLGNDFLAHLPSLKIKGSGVNVVCDAYRTAFRAFNGGDGAPARYLVGADGESVCLAFLEAVLGRVSSQESKGLQATKSVIFKDVEELEALDSEKIHVIRKDCIRMFAPGHKARYYAYYGISDRSQACEAFLQGMLWVIGYYKGHLHKNWTWFYPFDNSPFASDLFQYVSWARRHTQATEGHVTLHSRFQETRHLTAQQQLFLVLPKQSLVCVFGDTVIRDLIKLRCMSEYFPDKLVLDAISREHLWQSKAFLKPIPDSLVSMVPT